MTRDGRQDQGGFVLLVVLFVLLALFALTAPFLATARNADAASHFDKDGAQLRLALDGAARHARQGLDGTHVSLDPTPYFDGADELTVSMDFPEGFEGVNDTEGVAIGVEAADLAGRIDLNSAPPQVLANLLGRVARLTESAPVDAKSLKTSSPETFESAEVIFINGEIIRLDEETEAAREARTLKVADRGVGAVKNKDDEWFTNGPLPPRNHGVGAYVFSQRVMAPGVWRTLSVDGRPQTMDAIEEIRASEDFSMSGGFSETDLRVLRRTTTPYGAIGAGPQWQRPTRLTAPLAAGESYQLRLSQGRWMVPGATIKITNGITTELRSITERGRDGSIFIDRVVDSAYEPFATEVSVLVKRPVNVNSASAEVLAALFTNLKLTGQNHRIQETEAAALAALVIQSRPFDSFEDFVKRIVLPSAGIDVLPSDAPTVPSALAGGGAVLDDARDAVALYYNALNANDARLEFATMPLSFTSRSVFEMELRANVSAKSGVERASGVRERIELIVPQRPELLHVFARQEDFDSALRLTRSAPYWLTGPEPTGRYDNGVYPPSRAIPHLGTLRGGRYIPGIDEPVLDGDENLVQAERVFASRQEQAWVQLDPIRVRANERTQNRILHFDLESRSVEGRFLPDQPIVRDGASGLVGWVSDVQAPVVKPLSLSMWVRPEASGQGTLMSLGSRGPDADRVIFGMSEGNLVLRVLDGMGDHRDTEFQEVAEVRMPLASDSVSPGLPTGIWSHLDVDLRGNRPDQMSVLVNGSASGVNVQGMTRLTVGLQSGSGLIGVESTDGFPPVCTLRIGSEIIEATVAGPTSFAVSHSSAGALAGYGGRLARVAFNIEGTPDAVPSDAAAATISGSYGPGTTVTHYGYSLPLTDNVPSGESQLPGDLGIFRVGRCQGDPSDTSLEPIQAVVGLDIVDLGLGWSDTTVGPLKLGLADAPETDGVGRLVLPGFNPQGGYAVLSQLIFSIGTGPVEPPTGGPVGGVEIIRYSGISDGGLNVVERGVQPQRFGDAADGLSDIMGGARQFVFSFGTIQTLEGIDPNLLLNWSTFCYPISMPVPNATDLSFAVPTAERSQFAQLTRIDDPEATEWVRYDEVDLQYGQLLRSDPATLLAVHNLLTGGGGGDLFLPGPGGGTGTGGGGGGGGASRLSAPASPPLPSAPASRGRAAGTDWDPIRGEDPNVDYPLSRAVASTLHFRGVLGTNINEHPAGTSVLPVTPIRVRDGDFEMGRPGAKDPVFLVNGDLGDLGYPLSVHRANYPAQERMIHTWSWPLEGGLTSAAGESSSVPNIGYIADNVVYVAFDAPALVPTPPGTGVTGLANVTDPRFLGRMVKFPSGELPRIAGEAAIGVGASGITDFGAAAVTVDEVIFGDPRAFGGLGGTVPATHTAGAPMILSAPVGESDLTISVFPNAVKAPDRTIFSPNGVLEALPSDGGLLRIDEEIVAYRILSAIDGRIDLAFNGRGLLGTRPAAHAVTAPVTWLEGWEVSTLAGDIGPDDSVLPITSVQNFPSTGTVLIGAELVHYTQVFGGALVMPRSSGEPGAMDGLGPGVFRGRFGTPPSSQPAGSAVIQFPARYWDRYAPRFEGPELAFFGLSVDQPGAFWNGVLWDAQESQTGGAEVVVLQRSSEDVPWDANPEDEPYLALLENEDQEGLLIPIGQQSDRVEWRIFARYAPGSFDAEFGLSHGWKDTPRFVQLAVSYTAPPRVYRSIDR